VGMVLISRRLFLNTAAVIGLGFIIPLCLPCWAEAAFRLGDVPSTLVLNDLKGNSIVIPTDFKGKVALLHFWASWCPTCRAEMMALEAIYVKYGSKGGATCSIGIGEKKETALSYIKNMGISYPVLLDPDKSSRKPFGISGIPTYYILDREGLLRHRILGEAGKGGLENILGALLSLSSVKR
jgi:cytochrome c biogenesis protein CcmG, thiol:disulfide interchange protein DsbE